MTHCGGGRLRSEEASLRTGASSEEAVRELARQREGAGCAPGSRPEALASCARSLGIVELNAQRKSTLAAKRNAPRASSSAPAAPPAPRFIAVLLQGLGTPQRLRDRSVGVWNEIRCSTRTPLFTISQFFALCPFAAWPGPRLAAQRLPQPPREANSARAGPRARPSAARRAAAPRLPIQAWATRRRRAEPKEGVRCALGARTRSRPHPAPHRLAPAAPRAVQHGCPSTTSRPSSAASAGGG